MFDVCSTTCIIRTMSIYKHAVPKKVVHTLLFAKNVIHTLLFAKNVVHTLVFAKNVVRTLLFAKNVVRTLLYAKKLVHTLVFAKNVVRTLLYAKKLVHTLVFAKNVVRTLLFAKNVVRTLLYAKKLVHTLVFCLSVSLFLSLCLSVSLSSYFYYFPIFITYISLSFFPLFFFWGGGGYVHYFPSSRSVPRYAQTRRNHNWFTNILFVPTLRPKPTDVLLHICYFCRTVKSLNITTLSEANFSNMPYLNSL